MARSEVDTTKSTHIHIRVAPFQRELIDRAAQAVGKSRTEFILDVTTREAESTLLDQRFFLLDEGRWDAFVALLDAPASPSAALSKTMAGPAPWDDSSRPDVIDSQ